MDAGCGIGTFDRCVAGVGKVSYLGGHKYGTQLPISNHPGTQGTRYFLNALFEAPCSSSEAQPEVSTWVSGPEATNFDTYTTSVCYENTGDGLAFDAVLTLTLPPGATFISATDDGFSDGSSVTWVLGSLPAGASGRGRPGARCG